MKIKIIQSKNLILLLSALIALGLVSCKKYNSMGFTPGTGAPTITSVHTLSKTLTSSDSITTTTYDTSGNISTTVKGAPNQVIAFDSATTAGNQGQYYVIYGTNLGSTTTVLFNGVSVYFNRALITDKSIIVTIPLNVPTIGPSANDTLTVVTLHGTAYYKFTIITPPPTIATVSDYNFWAGSLVTLTGVGFASITSVGLTGSNASITIVSQTDAQIVLQFDSTTINRGNLVFSYSSAGNTSTETTTQEFVDLDNAYTIFYKNNFNNGWQDASWQGPSGLSTAASHSGTASALATYPAGNWAVEGWAAWNPPHFPYDPSYTYFTFWIKGGTVDHKLYIVSDKMPSGYGNSNTNPPASEIVDVPPAVWTYIKIPLGPPSSTSTTLLNLWATGSPLQQIGFFLQGQSGDVNETMYFDEVAFVK
jgi:hypothetical protein